MILNCFVLLGCGLCGLLPQQLILKPTTQVSAIVNRNDFSSWLMIQPKLSIDHILRNIGGSSFNSDLLPGVVVAASSTERPNYNYQWVRDAALTVDTLITHLDDTEFSDGGIAETVEHYILNNYMLQRVDNPSGTFTTGGLGEPKFRVDNRAFEENWGRPQNDGPALRSVTVMNYLNLVEKYNGDRLILNELGTPHSIYYDIVKPDLHYILKNWHKIGFDLWEENKGHHFFTSICQLKALKKGIVTAAKFGDYKFMSKLKATACKVENFLYSDGGFVDEKKHHIYENPEIDHKAGLDIASVIGSLVTHAGSNTVDNNSNFDIPFDIDDSYILNSFYYFIKDQNERYPLNHDPHKQGIGLGRYPNDVYDGVGISEGNPWFLSNAYASLYLYRRIYKVVTSASDLVIYSENYDFYNEFIANLTEICSDYKTSEFIVLPFKSNYFSNVTNSVFNFADSFLKIVLAHITDEGELSEQFNRVTGFSQGAKNLTWSYSSVWGAIRERSLIEPLI